MHARANPAKMRDFADKDLLQHIDLARIIFDRVISTLAGSVLGTRIKVT